MTIHLVSLPHTQVNQNHLTCAYTQKVYKFSKMFPEAQIYAPEGSHVSNLNVTLDNKKRKKLFGKDDKSRLPFWPEDTQWEQHNEIAVKKIRKNAEPGDIVLISGGWSQRQIIEQLSNLIVAEPFVGYPGIVAKYCAFESHAWRHHVYGDKAAKGEAQFENIRWYDTVIPNFFDPDDFSKCNEGEGEYLLFLGRVTQRKGPHIAAEIAKKAGIKLIIAGPGVTSIEPNKIIGDQVEITGNNNEISYVGSVGVKDRAKLLSNAKALICPTLYVEPFGGVAVEAMLSGTPVIAPPLGAFTETVKDSFNGYFFNTLSEGVNAVERVVGLNNTLIAKYAREKYSLQSIKPRLEVWFKRLETLYGDGWYSE